MNYYKRHLGDYARDTGHLSALEHGIYGLLLDWYYINERPIPADKAFRIAKGNRTETETVLSEFFTLGDEGWRHARADREIADYQARAEVNRVTGKLGGRPRKTQTVSERKPNGNPNVTLATSHKPQEEQEQRSKDLARPSASRFGEFWSLYPVKKGKADAERKWKARKLDAIADRIMADVRDRMARDRQWRDGYVPHGSTYVNGSGWEDAIVEARAGPAPPMSKTAQAFLKLGEMRGPVDAGRNHNGDATAALPRLGPPAADGADRGDGHGLG